MWLSLFLCAYLRFLAGESPFLSANTPVPSGLLSGAFNFLLVPPIVCWGYPVVLSGSCSFLTPPPKIFWSCPGILSGPCHLLSPPPKHLCHNTKRLGGSSLSIPSPLKTPPQRQNHQADLHKFFHLRRIRNRTDRRKKRPEEILFLKAFSNPIYVMRSLHAPITSCCGTAE